VDHWVEVDANHDATRSGREHTVTGGANVYTHVQAADFVQFQRIAFVCRIYWTILMSTDQWLDRKINGFDTRTQ